MTPATASVGVWAGWAWPAEVQAFARERGAERHLGPLLEALARLFPTATQATAALEASDFPCIALDVTMPSDDVRDIVAAKHAWFQELSRVAPTLPQPLFSLVLYPR